MKPKLGLACAVGLTALLLGVIWYVQTDPVDEVLEILSSESPDYSKAADLLREIPAERWDGRLFYALTEDGETHVLILRDDLVLLFRELFPEHLDVLFRGLKEAQGSHLASFNQIWIIHAVLEMPSRLQGDNDRVLRAATVWWLNWWERNRSLPGPDLRVAALDEVYLAIIEERQFSNGFNLWAHVRGILPEEVAEISRIENKVERNRALRRWYEANIDNLVWDDKSEKFRANSTN